MNLRKATKQKVKLRVGLAGTAGSGKTYSALLMASGMTSWDKIALIDTENGSGDLYSNLGPYNVLPLTAPFTPEKYIQAIQTCEREGMEVIVIDSITHEWDGEGGLLEVHTKMQGNSFTNWGKITPRHNAFIQGILKSSCHIITTVRKKQDYDMSQNNGKTIVTKVGLKDVQRDGFEYELTVNLEIDMQHMASSGKDRTGLFVNKPPFIITAETGKQLLEWCQDGSEPIIAPVQDIAPTHEVLPTPETPHLLALQKELRDKGATTRDEALSILNTATGKNYDDLQLSEEEASSALIMILQAPKAEENKKSPKKIS